MIHNANNTQMKEFGRQELLAIEKWYWTYEKKFLKMGLSTEEECGLPEQFGETEEQKDQSKSPVAFQAKNLTDKTTVKRVYALARKLANFFEHNGIDYWDVVVIAQKGSRGTFFKLEHRDIFFVQKML